MKKIVSLLLVLVVVLGCVGLAACGGDGGAVPENGDSQPTNGGEEPSNGGEEPSNGGDEDLGDILGQGAGINSVSYTMETTSETTSAGMTVEMQMWVEGNKARIEMDEQEHIIYIVNHDAGEAYMYMPDQGIAMRVDISMAPKPGYEGIQDIPDYDYTIIGTETMDGKVCLVAEYSHGGDTFKCWIWKEHGFPVRIDTTTPQGTMVVLFKNISFGDIADSLFELPSGVQIMSY